MSKQTTTTSTDISLYNDKPRVVITQTTMDSDYSYNPLIRTAYVEYDRSWELFTSWDGMTYPLDSLADGIALAKLALKA